MLLRRDICKSFAVYLQRKPLTSRQTTPYKSQQNRLLPPDRVLKPVGAKEAYELRRHFHHTGGTQKQRLSQPTKWHSRKNGKAARRLRTLRLTGELDSHGYRHHPEHTGKRLALFPVISKRSFYVTLSSPTCFGWVWRCLFANTDQAERGAHCSL